ncbi:MAG: alpha/beta fold hydrolase [Acidimicrobiia bacterium]|nr:alpha/beta fold hydrolase [Acidimicrobiia bacterium]
MQGLQFVTRDGFTLQGRWLPATSNPRGTAVVIAHGFTASKDDPEVDEFARGLADAGHDVLTYDSRGHNDSEGLCTLGDSEQFDVEAAVREARLRSGTVVVFGASMGAIAALRYAATDHGLAGAVSLSSPARWRVPRSASAVLAILMTRTKLGRYLAARFLRVRIHPLWTNPPPPEALVSSIRVPLAVVHGQADSFIHTGEARRLVLAAVGPTRLELVPRMGHAFDRRGIPSIRRAIDWALATAPA